MKIVSFDVGIKNMAYCVLEYCPLNKTNTILFWDVINLMPDGDADGSSKNKTVICSQCKKKAIYTTTQTTQATQQATQTTQQATQTTQHQPKTFCNNHAEKQCEFLKPIRNIAQMKKQELEQILGTTAKTKAELLIAVKSRLLQPIAIKKKAKKAQEISLIDIGRSIHQHLSVIHREQFTDLDFVLIENQISPIATRMKTIQGMLTQYFIMTSTTAQIEFISSHNKLSAFTEDKKEGYASNKKAAIMHVAEWLKQNNENNGRWETPFQCSKKKDDLADCLLQGLWKTGQIAAAAAVAVVV